MSDWRKKVKAKFLKAKFLKMFIKCIVFLMYKKLNFYVRVKSFKSGRWICFCKVLTVGFAFSNVLIM